MPVGGKEDDVGGRRDGPPVQLVERGGRADLAGVEEAHLFTVDNAGDEAAGAVNTQPPVVVRTTMSGSMVSEMR